MKVRNMKHITFIALAFVVLIAGWTNAQVTSDSEKMFYNKALSAALEREYVEVKGSAIGGTQPLARRFAIVDAQRNFVEFISGARIDSRTNVDNLKEGKDEILSTVKGVAKYYEIIDESFNRTNDGRWQAEVKARIPLKGLGFGEKIRESSLDSLKSGPAPYGWTEQDQRVNKILAEYKKLEDRNVKLETEIQRLKKIIELGLESPEDREKLKNLHEEKQKLLKNLAGKDRQIKDLKEQIEALNRKAKELASKPNVMKIYEKGPYAGLIVDARGLNADKLMLPKILTRNGMEIYGPASLIHVGNFSTARYVRDMNEAKKLIGEKQLIVNAIEAKGIAHKGDLVVDDETAIAIFASNIRDHFFELGKVVFVVD